MMLSLRWIIKNKFITLAKSETIAMENNKT